VENRDGQDRRSAKSALRAEMRASRGAIAPEDRDRLAAAIQARLVALPELARAGTVMLFSSFGSEVSTTGLVRALAERGHRLVLPYIREGEMEAGAFAPDARLVPSGYGPLEPPVPSAVDPAVIDAVIVPGLAFDRRGYRVGFGGGHYDRYLRRLRPDAVRIGIGFSLQVVKRVPTGPRDERVDLIVTEAEAIECLPPRPGRRQSPG
jgi:5-formyltetrahydrofolate cyclo-ligase